MNSSQWHLRVFLIYYCDCTNVISVTGPHGALEIATWPGDWYQESLEPQKFHVWSIYCNISWILQHIHFPYIYTMYSLGPTTCMLYGFNTKECNLCSGVIRGLQPRSPPEWQCLLAMHARTPAALLVPPTVHKCMNTMCKDKKSLLCLCIQITVIVFFLFWFWILLD